MCIRRRNSQAPVALRQDCVWANTLPRPSGDVDGMTLIARADDNMALAIDFLLLQLC